MIENKRCYGLKVTLRVGLFWHCISSVIPLVRPLQARSVAARSACSRVVAALFPQLVLPLKVTQTSQCSLVLPLEVYATSPTTIIMKAAPRMTGHFRLDLPALVSPMAYTPVKKFPILRN